MNPHEDSALAKKGKRKQVNPIKTDWIKIGRCINAVTGKKGTSKLLTQVKEERKWVKSFPFKFQRLEQSWC